MKKKMASILSCALIMGLMATTGCGAAIANDIDKEKVQSEMQKSQTKEGSSKNQKPGEKGNQYSLKQAMSDNAQLSTIAFNGLAFITGSSGADTFMPPGKVADFFGFQYMRDVDTAGYGHNTTFLTKAAANVLHILNDNQKKKLAALAKEQAPLYIDFAYNRFPIMNAFRRSLEGKIPEGSTGLDIQVVSDYTANLYKIDADLSYNRAIVVGEIINSFTEEQKIYLEQMKFNDSSTWPSVEKDDELKKSMSHTEFIAVMTYASELFSWYKGGLDADIYFCPERHGTYFGGFYMKDYPAMNNPDYFISTAITGDSGKEFLNILNSEQRALITGIIEEQRSSLNEIGQIRTEVSSELRRAMTGEDIDKEKVYSLIKRYGELDGQISALYARRFSEVNKTLTDTQRAELVKLRNLDVVPSGAYRFSTPVAMPEIPSTDFMFGVGNVPEDAGQMNAPESFSNSDKGKKGDKRNKGKNKSNSQIAIGVGAVPALSMISVPDEGFSFGIQADSHLDANTDTGLYKQTLENIAKEKPSFLIDLGDTFMSEKFAETQEEVEQRYIEAKAYFDVLDSIPLYLVNGNHDGEGGWDSRKGKKNMTTWARDARLKYFPSPTSEESYSGNRVTANYYSFIKNDAQFIVLDPFTYTTQKAKDNNDGWNYTLGKDQYDWFKELLENSSAKYKFVFIHNLVGGYGKDARGGAEAAKFFEWGGYNSEEVYEFDKMRPDWGKPIHQLMVDNNVTVVFHGHDHFYAKQELDGIIYQLVPQPGTPGNSVNDAEKYSYKNGVFLPSAGHLRVVVSDSQVAVEYVKSSLQENTNQKVVDSYILHSK